MVVNFEVARSSSFRYLEIDNFLTAEAAAAADIDDSIMRSAYASGSHKTYITHNSNKIECETISILSFFI